MSAAEAWICNRNFEGIDIDGKPHNYTCGEPVPNVEDWPTFASLRNIDWIIPNRNKKPADVIPIKPEKKRVEVHTKEEVTADIVADVELESCNLCDKQFKSKKALKINKNKSHK